MDNKIVTIVLGVVVVLVFALLVVFSPKAADESAKEAVQDGARQAVEVVVVKDSSAWEAYQDVVEQFQTLEW